MNSFSTTTRSLPPRAQPEAAGRRLPAEPAADSLARRTSLLQSAIRSAHTLLTATDFDHAVNTTLSLLGSSLRVDRATLFRTVSGPHPHRLDSVWITHEWHAPGMPSRLDSLAGSGPYLTNDLWRRPLNGTTLVVYSDDFDRPQTFLHPAATMLALGVTTSRGLWGVVGFDDLHRHRAWEPEDIHLLETATACIAAAIERYELERANDARRARYVGLLAERERRKLAELARLESERARAEASESLTALLRVIVSSARELLDASEFESALLRWLGRFAEATQATRASLYGPDPQQNPDSARMRMMAGWSRPADPGAVPSSTPPSIPGWEPFTPIEISRRLATGECVVLQVDLAADPPHSFRAGPGQASIIAIPMFMDGRLSGCIALTFTTRQDPSPAILAVFQTAADTLATVLRRNQAVSAAIAEREHSAQARAAELQRANLALGRATAGLVAEADAGRFLCSLMAETSAMTTAKTAGIFTYDSTSERLRMFALMTGGREVDLRSDPRMEVWRDDVPVFIARRWIEQLRTQDFASFDNHTAGENHPWPISRDWHRMMGHRYVITVPLYAGKTLIGTFGQCFPDGYDVARFDFGMTRVLANHAALALHMMHLSREARESATTAAVMGERNRIARDLHDTLAQGFAGVIAQLGAADGFLELEQLSTARAYLHRAKSLARYSLAEARTSVHALRPSATLPPLRERLEGLMRDMTQGLALSCVLREGGVPWTLSPALDWCAYKFVQEALANTMKHAGALQFEVELSWTEHRVQVQAMDDGQGLKSSSLKPGMGLTSMAERAAELRGHFHYESRPNAGLLLTMSLPRSNASLPGTGAAGSTGVAESS